PCIKMFNKNCLVTSKA
ncbi:hypothetical protein D041_1828B, partial [Vibrio parahaemolyticus EKP-008]